MTSERDWLEITGETGTGHEESYELGDCIGGGGASYVYECTQPQVPGKVFAMKVLRGTVDGQKLRAEIEMMQEANHIHVVRVRGISVVEGMIGVVLQPRAVGSEGNTLREYLDRTQPPIGPTPAASGATMKSSYEWKRLVIREKLLAWMRCLICTTDYLHREKIIHGDIKPQNILLTKTVTGEDRILLTDFGISMYTDAVLEVSEQTQKPLPGVTTHLGTTEYLHPSAFADKKKLDVAEKWGQRDIVGDVYALGCVFWEMLALIINPIAGEAVVDPPQHVETFAHFWTRKGLHRPGEHSSELSLARALWQVEHSTSGATADAVDDGFRRLGRGFIPPSAVLADEPSRQYSKPGASVDAVEKIFARLESVSKPPRAALLTEVSQLGFKSLNGAQKEEFAKSSHRTMTRIYWLSRCMIVSPYPKMLSSKVQRDHFWVAGSVIPNMLSRQLDQVPACNCDETLLGARY